MNTTRLSLRVAVAILIFNETGAPVSIAAPLTNPVPITHNLYFQLRKRWGPPTNQFFANEVLSYKIGTTATNHGVAYRYFPPDRSFVFRLLDAHGGEVAKTLRGIEFSRAPRVPRSMSESARLHGYDGNLTKPLFRPDDMFALTNSGIYQLEISIRLWVQTTNRGAPNELSELTQPGIGTNYQFGVVTSPPVRVRIIKR